MMSLISTVDRWSDWSGEGNDEYMTVEFVVVDGDKVERVDIKHKENEFTYIMDCANGYPVYKEGTDEGYRELTKEEYEELIGFADEQFERKGENMDREYYKKIYIDALNRIEKELIENGVDVSDGTAVTYEFDGTANAEEVVGYYVFNEGSNALNQWRNNTEGIQMTDQDKKVTRLLKALYE